MRWIIYRPTALCECSTRYQSWVFKQPPDDEEDDDDDSDDDDDCEDDDDSDDDDSDDDYDDDEGRCRWRQAEYFVKVAILHRRDALRSLPWEASRKLAQSQHPDSTALAS